MPWIEYETQAGEPFHAGDMRIIPLARTLRIRIPGLPGGLVWNRPAALAVQTAGGEERVLPVQDVTRQAQLALLGAGLIGSILVWSIMRMTRRRKD